MPKRRPLTGEPCKYAQPAYDSRTVEVPVEKQTVRMWGNDADGALAARHSTRPKGKRGREGSMQKTWKNGLGGRAGTAGWAWSVQAKLPGGGGAATGVPGAAVAPAAPPPSNLFSFLCPTPDQLAACKQKICNSMIGQLLNNSLKPA